jgi:AcrR family transcriptional regulator
LPGKKTKEPPKTRRHRQAAQEDPTRRQQNKSQFRMRILRAAMNVFGRLGHADTRVEDILEDAGVSRPTFYRYFKSKDDVFDAVDEVVSMSFLQTWTSAVSSVDGPAQKLEKGVDAYLQWLYATGPVASVTRRHPSHPEIHITARRDEGRRMIVDVFRKETFETLGVEFDPWLLSMLQAATERAADLLIDDGLRPGDAERAKQSLMRILAATLSEGDFVLPPIPRAPKAEKPKRSKKQTRKKTTGSSK